jgi:hypothetical protein
MAHAFCIGAKKQRRRFSYRQSSAELGERILSHAGVNDEKVRSKFGNSFAAIPDADVRLGVESQPPGGCFALPGEPLV